MVKQSNTNMASNNPPKRKLLKLTDSDSDRSMENEHLTEWPRFIIVESAEAERPISKLSPFAIHKGILGIAGTVKDL